MNLTFAETTRAAHPTGSRAGSVEVPLSRSQHQLWLAEQFGAHPAGYLVPTLLRLVGPVDIEALRCALRDIVARHETLRTSVRSSDRTPLGVLRPAAEFELLVDTVDEQGLAAAGGLDALLLAECGTPLDIADGLPIRARLVRLPDLTHVLCLSVHHIAFDDWSRRVFYGELAHLYNASVAGRPVQLPPLAVQYHEYTEATERASAESLDEQLGYWRRQLAGLAPFELQPDRPRPPRRAGDGASTDFVVSRDITEQLAAVGRRCGATLAMVLFAAGQVALRHYSGRDDVTLGTTVAERGTAEAGALIGPLLNTLVLRGDTAGDPAFTTLVERVRELTLDAFEHPDVPLSRLVEELGLDRDPSRTPLFQIMIGYGSGLSHPPALAGLTVTELTAPDVGSKWDMNIWFDHSDDGTLRCDLGWDRSLYGTDTMRRFAAHLNRTLVEVARRPAARIGDLQLAGPDERDAVRGFATGPRFDYPPAGLHERFAQQAARTPAATAVVESDGTATSYRELNARANRIADRLRRSGVGPDCLVGVCAERSLDLVTGLLAVLKAGAGYVPLDPAYPAERLAFMMSDAAVRTVLAQRHVLSALPDTGAEVLVLDDAATWPDCRADDPESGAHPDNAAYVIYTSGSSGQPKGVLLPHRAVVDRVEWMQRIHPLGPGDAVLQKAPMTFDASVSELFWPLSVGARIVLARPGGHRDTRYLRDLIVAEQVTMAQFVPSMLAVFLAEQDVEACTSLRLVVPGGEELPPATAAQFVRRLPGCALYNGYGPTEAAIYANWWHCRPDSLVDLAAVPLGAPFGNTRTYIVDDALRAVAPGAVGELCIGGAGLARAYLNRPGFTAERFRPDPFDPAPGARLYRTGDLVRLRPDLRSLDFLGRMDDQVKIRGFRVELGEVEGALSAHPAVDTAVAVVRDAGLSDRRLVAYVTAAHGAALDTGELRDHLTQRLPAHAVPGEIVRLDTVPRLPSGKVDRRALRRLDPPTADASTVDSSVRDATAGGIAALTPVQQAIAAIWAEVIGVARVAAEDNFFAIGGHSLSGIRAVNRMREHFDLDIPLSLFFDSPTVAALAEQIERALGEA